MDKLILIIEDDAQIADIVAHNLNREGFETVCADDGEKGFAIFGRQSPDLILLDIMLPGGVDGFALCARVRKTSSVPIIMLTARESEEDRIRGLEQGADDYVVKPFSMQELILRVKANLRRSGGSAATAQDAGKNESALVFDGERQEARLAGKRVELSARELELLRFLAAAPEKVYSREELLEKIWEYRYLGGTRVVDVAIRRLREKLEECAEGGKNFIATKHGLGYYFDPTGSEQ